MNDADFTAWVQHHAALFYMHTDRDELLFVAWRPLVEHCTLAELTSASNLLAIEKPAFRADHLHRLLTSVRGFREQKRMVKTAPDQHCTICGSTGWIVGVLPHLECIDDGEWRYPYYTIGAVCSCPLGRGVSQAQVDRFNELPLEKRHYRYRPCMTLEGYQQINPYWREMIFRKEERERTRKEADKLARKIDAESTIGNVGRLTDKILAGVHRNFPKDHFPVSDLPF